MSANHQAEAVEGVRTKLYESLLGAGACFAAALVLVFVFDATPFLIGKIALGMLIVAIVGAVGSAAFALNRLRTLTRGPGE